VLPASSLSAENGSEELSQAMRKLSATNPARNPVSAASLLWKSVGKGNLEAQVTLADLYLRGEGVTRSCEQARLLLRTAAGKGSAEAVGKLRTLQCH
jgi:TPR repeat protein